MASRNRMFRHFKKKKKNRFLDSRHDDLNLQMGGGYTSAVRQEEMNLTNNKIDDSGRIGQR